PGECLDHSPSRCPHRDWRPAGERPGEAFFTLLPGTGERHRGLPEPSARLPSTPSPAGSGCTLPLST
ncbi:hypothetical protein P7K49_022425, partial [Saguinus oedipus]